MMYYFSYGMNTNPHQMSWRCPTARSLGGASLHGYRFDFKFHATIDKMSGETVEGVLWEITDEDEKSLDILEGYPNYYTKQMVKVWNWKDRCMVEAMTYMMYKDEDLMLPEHSYYDMVKEGYMEHDISTGQLLDAIYRIQGRFDHDDDHDCEHCNCTA